MSTLSVDTIQGQTAAAKVHMAGAVLQIQQGTNATQMTATDSYADTGLSVAITPKFASSKIFIQFCQSIYFNYNGCAIRILRDSTPITTPSQNYQFHDSGNTSSTNFRTVANYQFLDSPNTTSAITYKTQIIRHGGVTVYANADNQPAFITVMEIAQ